MNNSKTAQQSNDDLLVPGKQNKQNYFSFAIHAPEHIQKWMNDYNEQTDGRIVFRPHLHITVAYGFDEKIYEDIKKDALDAKIRNSDLKFGEPHCIDPPHSAGSHWIVPVEAPKVQKVAEFIKHKYSVVNPQEVKSGRKFELHVTLLTIEHRLMKPSKQSKKNWFGIDVILPAHLATWAEQNIENGTVIGAIPKTHHITLVYGNDPKDYDAICARWAAARINPDSIKFGLPVRTSPPHLKQDIWNVPVESPELAVFQSTIQKDFNIANSEAETLHNRKIPLHVTLCEVCRSTTSTDAPATIPHIFTPSKNLPNGWKS